MKGYQKSNLPLKRIFSSFFALIVLLIILTFTLNQLSILILFVLGVVIGGYFFSREAIEAIFLKRKITTDVLMVLAYIAAAVLGQIVDALLLIFLYSITETLESITMQRTRSMIHTLDALVPKEVIKITNEEEIFVPVEQIRVNDIVKIRAGERTPVDGIIISGQCYVDESSITGEPIPVFKSKNDRILAGTFITDSTIKVQVDREVQHNTITRLIEMVEVAQKQKHPMQLLVNRFTRYYNPLIVGIAFVIFLYGLISSDIRFFGTMSASFLVAGAPCALAIGTPVTVIAAVGSAGKYGILVKGGAALEQLATVKAFAFDKTGTLTFGSIEVADILPFEMSKDDLMSIVLSLEHHSTHPFAKALENYGVKNSIPLKECENVKIIPGVGIEGFIDGKYYFIGKVTSDILENNQEKLTIISRLYKSKTVSVSYVLTNQDMIGIVIFQDKIRNESKDTITALHESGFLTYMLTGDNTKVGSEIGQVLGIPEENIYSNLLPEQKMNIIKHLKKDKKLAMIGDGINDTPALAMADLGIAMGIKGTDMAIETADISFMSEDISILMKGIQIAKKMKSVLKQNIIVSTAIIVIVLLGVLIGEINLPLAILAHEGSEVLIVGNSLRLMSKVHS